MQMCWSSCGGSSNFPAGTGRGEPGGESMSENERIRELEGELAELKAAVAALTASRSEAHEVVEEAPKSSRRGMLKLAGAAAVGTAVAVVGKSMPAAAEQFDILPGAEGT